MGNSTSGSAFVNQNMSKVGSRSAFEQDVLINFDVMVRYANFYL